MIECIRFTKFQRGNLQGFADFYLPKWGAEVHGCTLHMLEGRRWVNVPSKEYLSKDGEKKFKPLLRFREKKHWEIFCEQAKIAIDKWCKENSAEDSNDEEETHHSNEESLF